MLLTWHVTITPCASLEQGGCVTGVVTCTPAAAGVKGCRNMDNRSQREQHP